MSLVRAAPLCGCGCGNQVGVSVRRPQRFNSFLKNHDKRLPQTREKLSASAKPRGNNGLEGSRHPAWKGDLAGYHALHQWMNRTFPRAGACEACNGQPGTSKGGTVWANISGRYLRSRDDFWELCRKCHAQFDRARSATCQ